MIGRIRNNWYKAKAAVVVQNLLTESANLGLLESDPGQLANRLVSEVWEQTPDVFSGKFGVRPHKISIACAALSNGVDQEIGLDRDQQALRMALITVMTEIQTNGCFYELKRIDETLINACAPILDTIQEELNADPLLSSLNARGFV